MRWYPTVVVLCLPAVPLLGRYLTVVVLCLPARCATAGPVSDRCSSVPARQVCHCWTGPLDAATLFTVVHSTMTDEGFGQRTVNCLLQRVDATEATDRDAAGDVVRDRPAASSSSFVTSLDWLTLTSGEEMVHLPALADQR